MGLKAVKGVRQYVDFDPDGKVRRMYEVTFTTEKSAGEFTLDILAADYTAEKARKLAEARALEIDKAIG